LEGFLRGFKKSTPRRFRRNRSSLLTSPYLPRKKALPFTPLESPSAYGGVMLMKIQFLTLLESKVFSNGVYGGDDKINLFSSLLRAGSKPCPF
jgi:hypothetical protein